MALLDFMRAAFAKSLVCVSQVDLRLSGQELVVSFKAQNGFMPRSLNQQPVRLTLMTDQGPRTVSGKLKIRTKPFSWHTWYAYIFIPDREHEMFLVLDWEDCRWTNIQSLSLVTSRGERLFPNPCFRAPQPVNL